MRSPRRSSSAARACPSMSRSCSRPPSTIPRRAPTGSRSPGRCATRCRCGSRGWPRAVATPSRISSRSSPSPGCRSATNSSSRCRGVPSTRRPTISPRVSTRSSSSVRRRNRRCTNSGTRSPATRSTARSRSRGAADCINASRMRSRPSTRATSVARPCPSISPLPAISTRLSGTPARAREALEGTGGEAVAEARVTYADLVWAENDVPRAAELAAQALESARAEGTDRIVVRSLTVLGSALSRGGDAEGMSRLREAIALGQARGLGNELVDAYVELERAERAVGDWEAAIATAEAGLKLARERGHEFAQARLLSQLAFNYVSRGRYGDARTAAEQAVALARPGTVAATTAMTSLALVLTRQGEPSAALGVLDRIAPEMQRADPDQIANYLGERASALLGVGRLDDAQRTVNEGLELHRTRTGSGLTTFLVALDVAEARRDDAELERLIALFARQFAGRDTPTVRVLQQEMESVLLHLRTEDAASAFERVAGEYAALGVPMRAAYRRAGAAGAPPAPAGAGRPPPPRRLGG